MIIRIRIRRIWSYFLSGLGGAIAINYFITGFVDALYNINSLLIFLKKTGIINYIYHFFTN
jgi:hypothetical protein